MYKSLRCLLLFLLLSCLTRVYAGVPAGYYDRTDGLSGEVLKTQLYTIIKGHTVLTYSELWNAFRKTDMRADGKVWDVYSNTTNYVFGTDQDSGSGGGSEGEYYNREHSFPNSWFGGDKSSPMYTDLFHIYPSDKWVNNKRGNIPFGNVENVTGYSANHYCEWGTSTESGSALTVFEPADELKGDFARSYFYMVTCYEDLVASWTIYANTEMLGGNTYPAFSSWAQKVMIEWHRLDPVSAKEIARNDSIYQLFQHNRNPYIDIPSLAEYVWGDSINYAFHPSRYTSLPNSPRLSDNEDLTVWSEGNTLFVKTNPGEKVEIYNLSGHRIFLKKAKGNQVSFEIAGEKSLIVKVGDRIAKLCLQ